MDALYKMVDALPADKLFLRRAIEPLMSPQPSTLGYSSKTSQSAYYPGSATLSIAEIEAVTRLMDAKKIAPENTRLRRSQTTDVFEILQASAEQDTEAILLGQVSTTGQERPVDVVIRRGDHQYEMNKICAELTAARKLATTEEQKLALSQLIASFRTGDYESFRAAHQTWVTDKAPRVEHCMGFLFGYRDPHGVRAEWQAAAGIADKQETDKMAKLIDMAPQLIRTLPWAMPGENDGRGPFEPSELDVPDFAIIHCKSGSMYCCGGRQSQLTDPPVLASVSCTVWEATNITIVRKLTIALFTA